MRFRKLLLSQLALLSPMAVPSAEFAWRNIGPGGGGWIQSICASPHARDGLFVGCDVGGFYRSDDGGKSYTIHNNGLTDYWIECIVPHPTRPDTIYIGCESGIYRSDDGGRTWRWLRRGLPEPRLHGWSAPIGALVIDGQSPDTLYAGVGRPRQFKEGAGTVYKTTDGGETWSKVNGDSSLPADALISDLMIDPRDSRLLHLASQHGVFISKDAGATWAVSNEGLPHPHARRLARCRAKPDVLYLTVRSKPGEKPWRGGVYRSDDNGRTWQPRLEGLRQTVGKPGAADPLTANYDRLVAHPTNPDIAYAGGEGWVNATIAKTTDGGKSWIEVVRTRQDANIDMGWISMWGPSVKCLTMSPTDPEMLYFGTSGHVFKTTDGGNSWTQAYTRTLDDGRFCGTGLEVTCLHAIAVHPSDPMRIYFGYYDIGLLISRDGGATFSRNMQGVEPRSCANSCLAVVFDPEDPEHHWAAFGQWHENEGVIGESKDGGRSWTMIGTPESGLPKARHRPLIVDATSPRNARRLITVAEGHGIFASDDGGHKWSPLSEGLPHHDIRDLAADPKAPATLWCVLGDQNKTGAASVHVSADSGRTWKPAGDPLPTADVRDICLAAASPRRIYIAAREKYFARKIHPGGVFRSDDDGRSWRRILDDNFCQTLAVDPRNPDVVFVGRTDHPYHDHATGEGVWMTRDGGDHWAPINGATLTCLRASAITLDPHNPDRIFVGTAGNGAFVREIK